ncbi:hypothetical protein AZO1586I_2572 [Bathymodiolus thermophilus thioautotrophic gill symbiont]|uniref:Uncharacterized protein n=1 Tax=Bathymodiolus thermophilus thioautotrophic gill symbiont TaxID=2360 RepID=A0ABM8MBZ0_9GAMM|nr:hypothetical protein AZO1586I_2572 [Bathymodiolus thermophilus thioautotrophic gill symbiont]CAC9503346.1 hypothetical protein [uncultured Gammaproteobacteria bacterium]CAC9504255.1 hypothetical protein [uncultured Gammaproteobacteria bacterium]VVH55990.1 hypothetical protein BAZOLSSOX_2627 [uncultured Gammaproteobacteria bacterium]
MVKTIIPTGIAVFLVSIFGLEVINYAFLWYISFWIPLHK